MDLTGGKDSRLVLAVALTAGLADRFTLRTVGAPDLRDVQLASSLAGTFGLDHESGAFRPPDPRPYADRVRAFVGSTNGMMNIWDLKSPRSTPPVVRVSGMSGECLRSHRPVRPVPRKVEPLVALMQRSFRAGSLEVLSPELIKLFDDTVAAEITTDPAGGSEPLDLLGTFFVRNRARKFRGPMDELESDIRIWPLSSLGGVRAAYALGAARRQDELVHFEIMRRYSPILAAHPFAGPDWTEELRARLPRVAMEADRSAAPTTGDAPAVPVKGKAEPLMARAHREERGERRALLDDVLRERANPVWELLDQQVALDALERIESLTTKQRRQLYAVASAAMWAGADDR
jgi:hypothetical protein